MVSDDKVKVGITFPRDLLELVDTYCEASGLSRSTYFELLAKKDLTDTAVFLEEYYKQIGEILEKVK